MGINLKNVFNENEDELVVNRSRNAIKTLIIMSAVVAVVIVIAVIVKYSGDKDAVRRNKIIQDIKVLESAVENKSNEYRINSTSTELVGLSLEDSPYSITTNGITEEYRYGYYYVTPEMLGNLTNALNLPNEYYIVNYDTYDVINCNGVVYQKSKYYSMEDILLIEKGMKPSPKQIIRTAADLEKIRSNPSGYFRLSGNIDMSQYAYGEGWNPIANFSGTLDGRGYTISNLMIARPSTKNVGLFGELLSTAKITNLTFENVSIGGGEYVGTLAGVGAGSISHVSVRGGTVIGQTNYTGGLVGSQNNGTISNCKVSVDRINGSSSVGGVVGILYSGTLTRCSARATISGNDSIGGVVGTVSVSSATYVQEVAGDTTLNGMKDIGGIVGKIQILTNNKLDFANSYAKGAINGTVTNAGGLIGSISSIQDANISFKALYTTLDILVKGTTTGGSIGYTDIAVTSTVSLADCFWEKDLAPGENLKDIGDRASGTFVLSFDSESYSDMRIRSTFANWNFDIWGINEREDTPYLKWQI